MPFYECTLDGVYGGQDIKNVLWYRGATVFDEIGILLDAAHALAAEIKQNIWDSRSPAHIGGFGMQEIMGTAYTLNSITIRSYADTFGLLTSDPIVVPIGENGLSDAQTNGPATCAIWKANLEPALGPGVGLPKRGYLAVGPLSDADVTSTGHLQAPTLASHQTICDRLGENIVTELPIETYFPIRTRVTRVLHVVTLIAYKDVSGFTARSRASFRRSRQPEA